MVFLYLCTESKEQDMYDPTITIGALRALLAEGRAITFVDVRPKEQREESAIAGSTWIDAYQQLKAGDYSPLAVIQTTDLVVTICAAGGISQVAANALRERGINATSLEGGMKAWNSR